MKKKLQLFFLQMSIIFFFKLHNNFIKFNTFLINFNKIYTNFNKKNSSKHKQKHDSPSKRIIYIRDI